MSLPPLYITVITGPGCLSLIERCPNLRTSEVVLYTALCTYVCMELGQQAVPSIERCPSCRVVFIERFDCILNQDIMNYSSCSA